MTAMLDKSTVEARLDVLAGQIGLIAEEMAAQRQLRLQVAELAHDLSPVTGAAMARATSVLSVADAKGYLEFLTQLLAIVDRIVTSFGPDDVKALGDNTVLILEAVKEMTQPEVMTMLRRTAVSAQHVDNDISTAPSMFGLLRGLHDPEVRLGLARTLSVLRTIGAESANDKVKE